MSGLEGDDKEISVFFFWWFLELKKIRASRTTSHPLEELGTIGRPGEALLKSSTAGDTTGRER